MTENLKEEPVYTHRAIIIIASNGKEPDVNGCVKWDPDLEGKDIEDLGYLPASFMLVEDYILPALEQAFNDWEAGPLMNAPSPSHRSH
jgi:hypothetical protein